MTKSLFFQRMIRDIKSRKGQFFILIFILGLGSGLWYGMESMIEWRKQSILDFYDQNNLDDGFISFPLNNGVNNSQLQEVMNNYPRLNEISDYEFRLCISLTYIIFSEEESQMFRGLIYGVGNNNNEQTRIDLLTICQGNWSNNENNTILLEESFRQNQHISLNSQLTLKIGVNYSIVYIKGSFCTPEWLMIIDPNSVSFGYSSSFVISYCPLKNLQEWAKVPEKVNNFVFICQNSEKIDEIGKDLQNYLQAQGFYGIYTKRSEYLGNNNIMEDIESDRELFVMLAFIILIVAIFALWISLNRLIIHNRREIGIDLSLGVSQGRIMRYFLSFGLVIVCFSILVTSISGTIIAQNMINLFSSNYNLPSLVTTTMWDFLIQSWIICMFVGLFASWWPARQASRLKPITALREDPALSGNKIKNRQKKNSNYSHFLNINARMAFRNIFRNKKRTMATIIGFALSVGLVLCMTGVKSSLDSTIQQSYKEKGNWDMRVSFYQPIDYVQLNNITAFPTIQDFEYKIFSYANVFDSVNSNLITETIQINSLVDSQDDFQQINESLSRSNPCIVISQYLAKEMHIQINQYISVEHLIFNNETGCSIKNSSIQVSGFHSRINKIEAFMSLNETQTLMNYQNSANQILIYCHISDQKSLQNSLYSFDYVSEVEIGEDNNKKLGIIMSSVSDILSLFVIFTFALGFGIIYLTSTINRSEREREYGTMATLGASNRNILAISIWESSFLSFIGICLGFILGLIILNQSIIPSVQESFSPIIILINIHLQSYYYIGFLAWICAIISQFPLIRKLNKINLTQATKVRDF